MRKAVETLWEISPLGAPHATGNTAGKPLPVLAKHGSGRWLQSRFRAHASLHMPVKNDAVIRFAIDRTGHRCTLPRPYRIWGL